jgi:hypothetical protein
VLEVGVLEVGVLEVGVLEVGVLEVGVLEVGVLGVRVHAGKHPVRGGRGLWSSARPRRSFGTDAPGLPLQ